MIIQESKCLRLSRNIVMGIIGVGAITYLGVLIWLNHLFTVKEWRQREELSQKFEDVGSWLFLVLFLVLVSCHIALSSQIRKMMTLTDD